MKNITITSAPHVVQKDITILSPKGFIDTNTAPEFDQAFQTVLVSKRFNIVVDLKDVTYISSVGWGIFIGELKRIRTQNGNLVLANMTPEVGEAYKLLEFDSIIKAFTSVEEAVQKGFGRAQGKTIAARAPRAAAVLAQPAGVSQTSGSSQPTPAPEPVRIFQETKKVGFFEWLLRPWKW